MLWNMLLIWPTTVLTRVAFIPDEVDRTSEEHLVVEQQQVGFKDIGLLLQIFGHGADNLAQVVLGFDDSLFKPVDFVGGAVGIDKIFRNLLTPSRSTR